jgi:hypothetical protein
MSKYTTFKFVPVIGAVLAFAITAAEPAHAARNNACATASTFVPGLSGEPLAAAYARSQGADCSI